MASPVNTFKNNLFGQLKSYGDVVQGVFEQRIARPLLALKRDLSRPTSTTRTSSDRESVAPSTFNTYQESIIVSSTSSPGERIDIESNGSLKTIIDKVKNTFSPATKRRISEDLSIDETEKPIREHRHSSIISLSNKNHRRNRLRHFKSVSFADENIPQQNDPDPIDHQTDLLPPIADQNLMVSINERTTSISSTLEEDENDFERQFHQVIRPRRISIGNRKDLVYQDLSAEIVGYVLKHALRILEKEDEDLLFIENLQIIKKNEQEENFIDLK